MEPVRTFLLGGCLIHGPLAVLVRGGDSRITPARLSRGGTTPPAYTFGEMEQILRLYRGEIDIPPEIRALCGVKPNFEALPAGKTLAGVDVVLVEPTSPIDIKFRTYVINRACIFSQVTNPLKAAGRDIARLANLWFNKGLIGMDEDFRRDAAEKLVAAIPSDMANRDMAAAVLLESRCEQKDVLTGLRRVRSMIDCPIGIITYVFQYMPDGRPLSWPAHFREDVESAATALGLPVFEPWRLVEKHGAGVALRKDLRHYSDSFIPTIADAIEDFVVSVARAGQVLAST